MLADKQKLSNLTLQLTYFQADTGEIRTFFRKETALDLSSFLNELIDLYLDWIKKTDLDKGHRNRSITTGEFPYPSRRIGQARMMEEVYKTIAAIYPTLKALAVGQMEHVFYLTARSGRDPSLHYCFLACFYDEAPSIIRRKTTVEAIS